MDLQKHHDEAFVDFNRDKNFKATSPNDLDIYHFLVDFADKFIISRMLNQPRQLHLITVLKFDRNGSAVEKLVGTTCSVSKGALVE